MNRYDKTISNSFYVIKAFAIFSAVAAHCTYENVVLQRMTDIIGTIGVPSFLIVSGLFFSDKYTWKALIVRKAKRIVIPWFIWGCITYAVAVIASGISLNIIEMMNWIMGRNTWLYYVPVVLFCMAIYKLCRNKWFIILMIIVNIISCYLTMNGMLNNKFLTCYQNPFNWIGFFGIGILLRDYSSILEFNFKKYRKKNFFFLIGAASTICVGMFYCSNLNVKPSYWTNFSLLFEGVAIFTIYMLAYLCSNSRFLIVIGKWSYPIYFIHMQFGMKLVDILIYQPIKSYINASAIWAVVFVRPLLVIVASYFMLKVLEYMLQKMKLEKYKWLYAG